ncbi:phage tail sheath subtilisin-like domain-containing protein [Sutterella sp.]|uniref:phage tail sheath subtilisin-like domain-containing protein n=1 Tax=Sutterella sp. TaxID=1981025 RepID=UPI0026DF576F|nr:phage tail sheath subtilisin-like domain-containing protein [Sutterella sp.]MDO5531423.1 phage tail sheath subtilisin-like domain-containing protein [Sutterella sp.]
MSISFNTIPSGIRVPLFYAEVDNSAAYASSDAYQSLLIGQMLDSGTATVGKPVLVSTAAQAKKLFGRGSVLARMVEAFRNQATVATLMCLPIAAPDTATAATATITVAGTTTEAGTISLYIGGERVQTTVASGTAAAAVAQAIVDSLELEKDFPVTAACESNVVTLTAKTPGTLGNDISVALNLRGAINGEETPSGISLTITAMAGGAGDPDIEDATSVMKDERYDFIACPWSDAATLDALELVLDDSTGRWSPYSMLYGHVYTAKRGEADTLKTFGNTRNSQHVTVFGLEPGLPATLDVVLAAAVGRTAVFTEADPSRPTQTGELTDVLAASSDERFDLTTRNTLLQNGIATLTTSSASVVMIERAITTYQTNSLGDADASYLDSETMHQLAYIIRQLKSRITSKYARHKLADDGTAYGAGQAIVTPSVIRGELVACYAELEEAGHVENSDLFAKNLIVERNSDNPNRLDVLFPPDLVNQLRIFAVLNQFRLQY